MDLKTLEQTLLPLIFISSSFPMNWLVASWLIYFKVVLRLGLCPELRLTKQARSLELSRSTIDGRFKEAPLPGPATIKPVGSLPFDLCYC